MKSGWIDFGLVRDFLAEQTNAYRICTKPEAWAERFGNDALVSFKTERNRDAIIDELQQWSEAGEVHFARIFSRFLPKKDAERESPQLVAGDRDADLQTTVMERGVHFRIDFGGSYSAGLFVDPGKPSIRPPNRASKTIELFRLHVLVFRRRRISGRINC